jgi:hypothetical protein
VRLAGRARPRRRGIAGLRIAGVGAVLVGVRILGRIRIFDRVAEVVVGLTVGIGLRIPLAGRLGEAADRLARRRRTTIAERPRAILRR